MGTPAPNKPPLNEPTYLRVKRAIINDLIAHGFRPGDHLTIDMLTTRYNVSHMPIREALRQLEGEGILVSLAHRGFRIEALSESYIRNMYDIRIGLEAMMAWRASTVATPADIADLEAINARFADAAHARDLTAATAINIEFHERIYAMADNPEATQLLNVRTRIVRTVAQSVDAHVMQDRTPIIGEHAAIIDALRKGDGEAAIRAVFAHLSTARDRLVVRMARAGLIDAPASAEPSLDTL